MITQRGKILLGILAVFLIVVAYSGLGYVQYQQQVEINSLVQPRVVKEVKTIVVTPTVEPTATPAAGLRYTPVVKTATPVVKGVVK